MNVLVDFIGHADLYYSMHLLFEKRLGWNLYRPLGGSEWDDLGVITRPLEANVTSNSVDDLVEYTIQSHQYKQKAITLEQFKSIEFDFLVTTCHENENSFCSTLQKLKPKAKVIRQIANIFETPKVAKNVLLSTTTPMPNGVNFIVYHPEHRDIFKRNPNIESTKSIKSFFNYMKSSPDVYKQWNDLSKLLPEFTFCMHGDNETSDLGTIPHPDLPVAMQEAMFVWHVKPMGCCGYTARQALSCGKPLIVNKVLARQYKTLAENYLQDSVNCIDIDPKVRSLSEAANIIKAWSNPATYIEKSIAASQTFENIFSEEAVAIQTWLQNL